MLRQRFLLILCTILFVSGTSPGGWSTPGPVRAHERDVADVSVFYDSLAPYGTWTTVEDYGRVWVPRGVHAGWRPYTDGRWVYTDVGWTWVSDYDWGWAPFHYGRWSHHSHHGWFWVPGTVWGPAWVSWRRSPGWVGWAPLPPQVGFHVGIGPGAADIHVDIAPERFAFIEERHILAPHVRSYFAPPARNVQLVRETKNVTNVTVINNRVVDRSIDVKNVEKVTKRPVTVHRIVEVDAPEKARGQKVRDKEREVVLVRPAAAREPRNDNNHERQEGEPARQPRDADNSPRQERDEQQSQERQSQPEGTSAYERPKRQETESEEATKNAPSQLQESPPQQQEQQKQGRSGTAKGKDRRNKRDVQQTPSSGTTEDTLPRRQRRQQQPPHEEQGTDQRRQTSANPDNTSSSRDRQSGVTEPQPGQPPAGTGNLSPEARREQRKAVPQAGGENNSKRRDKQRRRQQSQEEQDAHSQETPANQEQ